MGADEYIKYPVTELSKFNSIQGCNIAMDLYFTSVSFVEWAMDHHFTIVGTMHYDCKGIPKEMKSLRRKGREVHSVRIPGQTGHDDAFLYRQEEVREEEYHCSYHHA